jgi:hypothetical protein
MQPVEDVAAGKQLVDKIPRHLMLRPTKQRYKIWVPKLTQHLHLLIESSILGALTLANNCSKVYCLDGDF